MSDQSTIVPGVHVIGDACIADAMPKSASAAYSQAQQCASAVAAMLFAGEVPEPVFESVCYSRLTPALAIAFPGHFQIADGKIISAQAAAAAAAAAAQVSIEPGVAAQESRAAQRWYADIRAQAFAA